MKIPSLADPALIFIRGKTKDEDAPERNSFLVNSTRRLHGPTPQRASQIIFSIVCEKTFAMQLYMTSRRSFLSPFILRPVLLHSDPHSFLGRTEKMDLPIMGNRYERERRTTQGVACTSAATSQTRARINRDT